MRGALGTRPHPSSHLSPAAGHPPLPLGLSSPLWACPLIFPSTVGFPWVLGFPLTPPCPPFSALSQRDILPCSVLGSSVIVPPPRTQFRSALWWDGSFVPVSRFCPGCILRSQCFLVKPSQAVLQGPQGPPRCPLKTGFRSFLKIAFATVSWMSLSLSDYLILQFVGHTLDYPAGSWLIVQGHGSRETVFYSSPGDMAKSGLNLDSAGWNDLEQGMELLWASVSSCVIGKE